MSDHSRLPEVPATALRDIATSERLDRVWDRLEHDLIGVRPRIRGSFEWGWAAAAVVIIFLSGFFAGLSWHRGDLIASVSPEPVSQTDNAPGNPGNPNRPQNESARPAEQPRRPRFSSRQQPRPLVGELTPAVPAAVPPVVADPGPPDWKRIWLEEQDADRAGTAVQRHGGFGQVIKHASAEELMILVSVAQAVGQPTEAVVALRRVVDYFPTDPGAPQAAFMLGTALEKAGDRAGAARAFATCRALSPQSEIAEDALARQIEAALEQGEIPGVRQLVEQYEREFPQGSRLAEFRAVLAQSRETAPPAAPSGAAGEVESPPDGGRPPSAAPSGP